MYVIYLLFIESGDGAKQQQNKRIYLTIKIGNGFAAITDKETPN
jgi:hypothetical protein